MYNKIKQFLANDSAFYGLLIVLVAITAYGLGQRSGQVLVSKPTVSVLQYTQSEKPLNKAVSSLEQTVVASKSGSKYHFLWCPGAKQIKDENRLSFKSEAEAQAAGYSLAANCK